jgi:hypothetical protein
MAAAEAEHTLQWVSLHEASRRVAKRSAADQEPLAAYIVELKFRNGEYRCYRYRDNGALHENDLSTDFLREAVIDVVGSAATRPARVERVPNPNLPYVRADCPMPQPQWFARGPYLSSHDPFLRPAYIEKTVPAKTITEIEVLVLRRSEPPVVEQVPQTAPRRGRPSSAPRVLEEAERRLRSDKELCIRQGRKRFLKGLTDWLGDTHPEARPMAPKTIGDHLRESTNIRALMPEAWFRRK